MSSSISRGILQNYYPVVLSLRNYLPHILSPQHLTNLVSSLSPESRDVLETSCLAMKQLPTGRQFAFSPPMEDMRDVIDAAQERILKSANPKNILTAGYRQASREGDVGKKGMARIGITNYYVNTIVTALQSSEWECLLQSMGAEVMLHILINTSIFIALPNDCLCQVTGIPLQPPPRPSRQKKTESAGPTLRAKRKAQDSDLLPTKRVKLLSGVYGLPSHQIQAQQTAKHPPSHVLIPRHLIFYSRPAFQSYADGIFLGIGPKHILNRLNPPKILKQDPTLILKEPPDRVRHLAKHVFPRQYGLPGPQVIYSTTRTTLADLFNKDPDIKRLGSLKTPKRLKEVIPLIDKLLWRHGTCKYKLLLDTTAPSKLVTADKKVPDDSLILEMMSEQSIISQAYSSTASMEQTPHPPKLPTSQTNAKPRFAEYACGHFEVHRFVMLATKAVVPDSFWGCRSNWKLVEQHVKTLIDCRRFETLTLHRVVQGFQTSMCEWLMPPGTQDGQNRVSVSDALKRRELLEDFLYWYFGSFVLSILKTSFYVTDSSAFRYHILYFRQDDWRTLCIPLIKKLTQGTFQKLSQLEAEEILKQRSLGFSFIRLLPKETGVRPIINLRRKNGTELSINQILGAAFEILTYEKRNQQALLGAAVFSHDDTYARLKKFKTKLLKDGQGRLPELYFVKVDVQACFDTIEQDKLLQILREMISEDIYVIQRYGQMSSRLAQVQYRYRKRAIPEDDHPDFVEYARELAGALRHTIFVDNVVYPLAKKQDILQLLEDHITENIVKIGQEYYRQVIGIPQGSVLSTLLCAFFYGDMERKTGQIMHDGDAESTLLRLVDDYLFITTNQHSAQEFLDAMNRGHPEYGCFISKDKTMANFDYDEQIMNVTGPGQEVFPWCGLNINMKDLSVSVDYTRYHGMSLSNTLTVDRGRRAGESFVRKMLQLAKARSHSIYSDSGYNTDHSIRLNIYQNFLLSAMKMHAYIRDWGLDPSKHKNFLYNTVQQMSTYCYKALRNGCRSTVAKCHSALFDVHQQDILWLAIHAFHTVFSCKAYRYRSFISRLSLDLSLPSFRRRSKRFRHVIQDGLSGVGRLI